MTTGHLFVKSQNTANQMQNDGAYLNELQLTREQLVRDEIVLDVPVVVLEQIDADERVDGGWRQREHGTLPIGLAKARLARDQPVELEQRLLEFFDERTRVEIVENALKLERVAYGVTIRARCFIIILRVSARFAQLGPCSTQRLQVVRDLFHFDLELHIVGVAHLVILGLRKSKLILNRVDLAERRRCVITISKIR